MKTVLLVEDSPVTQSIVRAALKEVCRLETADSVAAAADVVNAHAFDLILLDINLPDGDGFQVYELIRTIEKYKATPILFLSARVDVEDKVRGFSLGADDYIEKPFDITVLRARIAAKLKNLTERAVTDIVKFGPFEVKVAAQKISIHGPDKAELKLELTGNQFKVLYHLLRHQDKVVTREDLLNEVWGGDVHVTGRTVDTHIYAIRRLLGDWKWTIQSIHKKGYKLSFNEAEKQTA